MSLVGRPRRSALYMPAANARAIEKARDLACDVVILDLEDAVAPDAKAQARSQVVEAVRAGGFGRREVVVRVNGLETPWGREDLGAVAAIRPDAVLVPKVSSPDDLRAYRSALGREVALWAMIETCAAAFQLEALAKASPQSGVTAWVVGGNDLAKEMRCRPDVDRMPLAPFLAQTVMAARMTGLAVLDGVYNDLEDDDGLRRQCQQGVAFGYDGKTLIHPRQVDIANAVFSPFPDEVAWSRKVVDAFALPENAGKGVLRLDGRMVERLHLEQAHQILAISDAIAA